MFDLVTKNPLEYNQTTGVESSIDENFNIRVLSFRPVLYPKCDAGSSHPSRTTVWNTAHHT